MNNFNKIWKEHLREIELDTSNLKIKDHLHPEFWKNEGLNAVIRERLLEIADDIFTNLELPTEIVDILLTGSIAGFNWHALSDIDMHILLDFREIDENFDLVKDLLDAKRIQWNKTHKIMIWRSKTAHIGLKKKFLTHQKKFFFSKKKNFFFEKKIFF